jgi:aryl-alcohol dehydrogenase-like predicted oxidoreductase
MLIDFSHSTLGQSGLRVHRLGLSATYRPGKATIHRALDEGINYFFGYGFDSQMMGVLRDILRRDRERYVIATGAYNFVLGHPNFRRTLERRLRRLGTEYIDVFLFLGVRKEREFPQSVREELYRLREEGRVRCVGLSTHNRRLAGQLAAEGAVDVLMVRYNAAHRGAEEEIFPYLTTHHPGVVSYTATRWRQLLRRPSGWPKDGPVPNAGMCYRFVLSNPSVDVCMTAPSNLEQLVENITAIRQGPLTEEDMAFMRRFGDTVHAARRWFM